MKRVFLMFFLLAAAGSLFAQLSWTGQVYAGLGMTKLDGEDKVAFGTGTGNLLGNDNFRFRLNGTYTNEEETAGARFRLQSQGTPRSWSLSAPYAFGWFTIADGLIKILGGRITENEFNTVDSYNAGATFFATDYGLQAYVYPSDMFKFGVGALAGSGLSEGVTIDGMTAWLGLGVDIDTFSLTAQMEAGKERVDVFASANFEGLSNLGLTLGAFVEAAYLNEFNDKGVVFADLSVEHSGILDAWFYVLSVYSQKEDYDMSIDFNFGAEYTVNNSVSAGLDVDFGLQGVAYDGLYSWDAYFMKELSFVGVKPYVSFSPNDSSASLSIGYYLAKDLSKIDPPVGKKGGINHAAFIDFSWSF